MTVLSSVTKVFCSMAFCSTSTNNKRSHCFGIVCKDASLRIKMIQRCHVSLNCSCYKNLLRIVITCGGKEKKKKIGGGRSRLSWLWVIVRTKISWIKVSARESTAHLHLWTCYKNVVILAYILFVWITRFSRTHR